MYNFNILYNYIIEYEKMLAAKRERLAAILRDAPPGNIYTQGNGHYTSYVLRHTVDKKRVKKVITSNRSLLAKYADKYYAKALMPVITANHEAAKAFLSLHSGSEIQDVTAKLNKQILMYSNAAHAAGEFDPIAWLNTPYHRLDDFEDPQHPTLRGDYVRSKSESMIADTLFRADILYKPECPLELEDRKTHSTVTYYPDFTILHPVTFEEIYWEHFGGLDDALYASKQARKMQVYSDNGIIQHKNLIITFETENVPFVARQAQQIVDAVFNLELL